MGRFRDSEVLWFSRRCRLGRHRSVRPCSDVTTLDAYVLMSSHMNVILLRILVSCFHPCHFTCILPQLHVEGNSLLRLVCKKDHARCSPNASSTPILQRAPFLRSILDGREGFSVTLKLHRNAHHLGVCANGGWGSASMD